MIKNTLLTINAKKGDVIFNSFILFLSSFLLFAIQPMAAKYLLPLFGGAPMVWNVCMLYFQSILLLSYLYSYLLNKFISFKTQKIFHFILLSASFYSLPILWKSMPSDLSNFPSLLILKLLILKLSCPLIVLCASAPLIQAWFARSSHIKAKDPYFFYIASNFGSLVALLSYPFMIESNLGLLEQSYLWSKLYLFFAVILVVLIFVSEDKISIVKNVCPTKISFKQKTVWIYLSFVPVSLMLGVTTFLSTDIASIPLLWVLPLALYLLTYIITFKNNPIISHGLVKRNVILVLIFVLLGFVLGTNNEAIVELVIFHLSLFFILALLCHGELYRLRPNASHLTQFYLYLALGGVLAGIFNSLIAPNLFNQLYEYPLAIILAVLVLISPGDKIKWSHLVILSTILLINKIIPHSLVEYSNYNILLIICLIFLILNTKSMKTFSCMLAIFLSFIFLHSPNNIIWQGRNFFGIKQVIKDRNLHYLKSQTTIHGAQLLDQQNPNDGVLTYYKPVKSIISQIKSKNKRVAIIGLGVGSIGCQFNKTDRVLYIEIDPQVIKIAQDPNSFTLLNNCRANIAIKVGDGRLKLAKEHKNSFDLIIIDAFTSDAIPTHLLTIEALTMYRTKLKSNGILLFHISNRHLNLIPILSGFSDTIHQGLLFKHFKKDNSANLDSDWALITTNSKIQKKLIQDGWFSVPAENNLTWTDDHSNILPLLKY